MSQLGVALPGMKPGDDRELKIIAADQMTTHGYWSEAVDLYLQAESMALRKPKLDAQLAPALAGAGQFSESIRRYRLLIKNDPKNAALVSNLAYTMMESGDPVSAEAEFRRALTIDPQYENAAVNLGLLLARQRRCEEALALLAPAIGESAAHHNLGVIAIDCGDEATAQQEFSLAASLPRASLTTSDFLAALSDSGQTLH
jgi:Flp pilus assembly protein TadD